MKRKFSFNLAPVKVPLRSDSQSTSSHTSSHHRQFSKDSIISFPSPFINRRPLDPITEQELRAACAQILKNFKPSDDDLANADPKLDFSGPHKRREQRTEVHAHKPTGAPVESRSTHDARKHNHKPEPVEKGCHDHPTRANTGRRRTDHGTSKDSDMRSPTKSHANEPPRSGTFRADIDSDDVGTPLTSSTDAHLNNGSTAPTSVGITSGRSSKRTSHQYESAATAADAQAAEWMRLELEKRQRHGPQPGAPPQSSHRPPSRSTSIRAGIKEYFYPGSTPLSRSQSRDSLRTTSSNSSSAPKRSGSSSGWRSWGLQRMSSSRTSSRPGTSSGRIERPEDKKPELNLNRELPPLPSLDTWKEPEQRKKEQHKSKAQGAHIATVMRSQDHQQQEYAAAVRKHHRKSGSDTLAMRYAKAHPQPPTLAKSPTHRAFAQKQPAPVLDVSMDFDKMMSAMASTQHLDDQLKLRSNGHVPQRSTSTASRSPSAKVSSDGRLAAPNFSRKISTDVAPSQRVHDGAYRNVVQISSSAPKDEQKGRLRKVFSGWMLRKEKKDDWMQKFEKEGIKGGVMIQDETASPPVVRY